MSEAENDLVIRELLGLRRREVELDGGAIVGAPV